MKSKLQTTLFGDSFQSTKTNKKQFLEKMDSLIPWQDWVSIIDPIYYEGKVGQKPYPIELMLRIIILQSFYDLADMAVMYEILDSRAFSDFCGVSSPEEVPNGDTIGRFRNLLIKHGIDEQIFAQVLSILNKHNLIINHRRGARNKLEPNDQLIFEIEEFAKSTVRSKVEHVFGVVKRLFRMRRTRYRGLRKQQAKFNITFALANLYLADKKNLLA